MSPSRRLSSLAPISLSMAKRSLLDWVTRSAKAVTAYFGRFPVANARMYIAIPQNRRVLNGVSYGAGGAHCRISVGQHATSGRSVE
jgi:hypothetical protein